MDIGNNLIIMVKELFIEKIKLSIFTVFGKTPHESHNSIVKNPLKKNKNSF
jgi:hypothetical protein